MTVTVEHRRMRQHLVHQLITSRHLTSPSVAAAVATVPRHRFAPAVYRVSEQGQIGTVLRGDDASQHDEYVAAVYSDDAIVTQIAPDGRPTSSSTQPGVMAVMLEALDLRPGLTVLEVGTGTGYNAALLSHIVGDDCVTSVDIDAGVVSAAAAALAGSGYSPTVVAADGLAGLAERAPYDRVIATCAVRRVPLAWLQQTAAGGVVLANLSYGVIPLRGNAEGGWEGRFLEQVAAFIEARPADGPPGPTTDEMIARCTGGSGTTTAGSVEDARLFIDGDCEFFWRLAEPAVYHCTLLAKGGDIHCMVDAVTGAWAKVEHHRSQVTVTQGGPRRVWDDIAVLCRAWASADRPRHHRLGLTVDTAGHHRLWVDAPSSVHGWDLPH